MSPTGVARQTDVYYRNRRIICLDEYQRLPLNWAVIHNGYHEFRTLSAAKRFLRSN